MLLEGADCHRDFFTGVLGVVACRRLPSVPCRMLGIERRRPAGQRTLGMMWAQQSQQEIGGKSPGQREAFEGDGRAVRLRMARIRPGWRGSFRRPGCASAPPLVVVGRTSVCDFRTLPILSSAWPC